MGRNHLLSTTLVPNRFPGVGENSIHLIAFHRPLKCIPSSIVKHHRMQYTGHALGSDLVDLVDAALPGPVPVANRNNSPSPSARQYISTYEAQHKASVLFSSVMLDIKAQVAARTLENNGSPSVEDVGPMDKLIDILGQFNPSPASMTAASAAAAHAKYSDDGEHWTDSDWEPVQSDFPRSDEFSSEVFATSDEDHVHASSMLKGLTDACAQERKNLRKKKRELQGACEVNKKPKRTASQASLSTEFINNMYDALRTHAPTTEAEYKRILEDYAGMYEVSTACLRNILTCKSRAKDSSNFWPDAVWELYRTKLRCWDCKEVDLSVHVLCSHHQRGRPHKLMAVVPAVSAGGSSSQDALLPQPKMQPLTDICGKERKLAREYKIQLEIHEIWEAFGLTKAYSTERKSAKATKSAKSAKSAKSPQSD